MRGFVRCAMFSVGVAILFGRCRRRWCGVFFVAWMVGRVVGLDAFSSFFFFFFFFLVLHHFLEEQMDGAFALFGFADFGAWGEDAEGGVDGDLFDGLGSVRVGWRWGLG